MRFLLNIHLIYLCSKARISFKDIRFQVKILKHKGMNVKYVGLIIQSPKSHSLVQLSGMHESSFHIALKKAFSELLESLTYWKNIDDVEESRSGMATFESFDLAYRNAYKELLERDSFIMHLYCPNLETRPLPSSEGIELAQLQSIDPNIYVVLARAFKDDTQDKPFIALAAAEDLSVAVKKAKEELVMILNEGPDFSQEADNDLLLTTLRPHHLALQSPIVSKIINGLIKGEGKDTLEFLAKPIKIFVSIRENYGQFVTVKLFGEKMLCLKFGQLWKNEYKVQQEILRERNLSPSHFLIHPLL